VLPRIARVILLTQRGDVRLIKDHGSD